MASSMYVFAQSFFHWSSPHCRMVNMLDWDIVVSKFELQFNYYVHFWTNTLEKGMNAVIHPQL